MTVTLKDTVSGLYGINVVLKDEENHTLKAAVTTDENGKRTVETEGTPDWNEKDILHSYDECRSYADETEEFSIQFPADLVAETFADGLITVSIESVEDYAGNTISDKTEFKKLKGEGLTGEFRLDKTAPKLASVSTDNHGNKYDDTWYNNQNSVKTTFNVTEANMKYLAAGYSKDGGQTAEIE